MLEFAFLPLLLVFGELVEHIDLVRAPVGGEVAPPPLVVYLLNLT